MSSGLQTFDASGALLFDSNNYTLLYDSYIQISPSSSQWENVYITSDKIIICPIVQVDPININTYVSNFGYFTVDVDIRTEKTVKVKKQIRSAHSSSFSYESYAYNITCQVLSL